jgi:hypothetical protein
MLCHKIPKFWKIFLEFYLIVLTMMTVGAFERSISVFTVPRLALTSRWRPEALFHDLGGRWRIKMRRWAINRVAVSSWVQSVRFVACSGSVRSLLPLLAQQLSPSSARWQTGRANNTLQRPSRCGATSTQAGTSSTLICDVDQSSCRSDTATSRVVSTRQLNSAHVRP